MAMKYEDFRELRRVAAALAVTLGVGAILYFALATPESVKSIWGGLLVVGWTLAPPIWFYAEYSLLEHGIRVHLPAKADKEAFLDIIKGYADYASKIWAGVLAILIFLFEVRTRKP